jgi:hypothetical protein
MSDDERRMLWIVWGSIVASQVVLLGVGLTVDFGMGALDPTVWGALAASALLPSLLAVVFGRRFVRWAAGEAVGLLGFVLVAAGGPLAVGVGLQALGLLLNVSQAPRE